MSAVYICECGHPKSQHKREREGCRNCDMGCSRFEADMAASAAAQGVERTRVLTAVAEVCEDQAAKARAELADAEVEAADDREAKRTGGTFAKHYLGDRPEVPDTPSTWARLAKAEQELGEVNVARLAAETELASARQELEQLKREYASLADLAERMERAAGLDPEDPFNDTETAIRLLREGRDQAVERALELAKELAEVRSAADEKVRALLAATANTADAYLATTTAAAADVLYAYDAWSCLTEGGCGSRYTRETATQDHPCGPLTAVRVTITHRTEGQQ